MFCEPYFKRMPAGEMYFHAQQGYPPDVVAMLCGFPQVKLSVAPFVALPELGGGCSIPAINAWCDQHSYPHPNIVIDGVDGATNNYTGDPNSADVEVHADISAVIGAIYWMLKLPANILVMFGPNSDTGYPHIISAIGSHPTKPLAAPSSWGLAESQSSPSFMAAMNAAFRSAPRVTFPVASGDGGSKDGTGSDTPDFPASSPEQNVIAVGGTTITTQTINGILQIVNETVWNHDGGAGGGGISKAFPVPAWQKGYVGNATGRCVPDCCINADPATGYDTAQFGIIGGTSLGSPMIGALCAVINAVTGKTITAADFYPLEKSAFFDVTLGNNGDYSATSGYDLASGLGRPFGDKLLAGYQGGIVTPPQPPVNPPPVNPPPPTIPMMGLQAILSVLQSESMIQMQKVSYPFRRLVQQIEKDYEQRFTREFSATVRKAQEFESALAKSHASANISWITIVGLVFQYGPVVWQILTELRSGTPAATIIQQFGQVATQILGALGITIPTLPPIPSPPPTTGKLVVGPLVTGIKTIW